MNQHHLSGPTTEEHSYHPNQEPEEPELLLSHGTDTHQPTTEDCCVKRTTPKNQREELMTQPSKSTEEEIETVLITMQVLQLMDTLQQVRLEPQQRKESSTVIEN